MTNGEPDKNKTEDMSLSHCKLKRKLRQYFVFTVLTDPFFTTNATLNTLQRHKNIYIGDHEK